MVDLSKHIIILVGLARPSNGIAAHRVTVVVPTGFNKTHAANSNSCRMQLMHTRRAYRNNKVEIVVHGVLRDLIEL